MLEAALPVLETLPQWDVNTIHDAMIALAGELGVKNGTLLWPVRIAAAGTLVTRRGHGDFDPAGPGGGPAPAAPWPGKTERIMGNPIASYNVIP